MNAVRRFLSAGGWLANMLNQFAGPVDFADHDSSIRPGAIFVVLSIPFLMASLTVIGMAGWVLRGASPPQAKLSGPALAVFDVALLSLLLSFIALVAYGWVSGFVPFVAYRADVPESDETDVLDEQPVRLGLTGIVALADPSVRRRYRNRPAALVLKDGEIKLLVDRWRTGYRFRHRSYAAVVGLDPGSVTAIVRGTAFLVSREMAAIRVATPQGPLVWTFATPESRDGAYNALAVLTKSSRVAETRPMPGGAPTAPDAASTHPAWWAGEPKSDLIQDVLYADRAKVRGILKFRMASDRGTLELPGDGLVFRGRTLTITAQPIAGVRLTRQAIPWLSYVLVTLGSVVLLSLLGFPLPLIVVLMAGGLVAEFFMGTNTSRWVAVEYRAPDGAMREAFFADGSPGRAGVRATGRLFARINAARSSGPGQGDPRSPEANTGWVVGAE